MRIKSILVLTTLVFFYSTVHAADLKINVQEVRVYKEMNPNSQVISTLFKGDMVKVSNSNPQGFQKVLIKTGGTQQIGYIKNTDLMIKPANQQQQQQQQGKPRMVRRYAPRGLANRSAVGLYGGINYQSQGSRSSTEANGTINAFGAMSGIGTRFGLGYQFPLSPKFSGKVYAEMKSVAVSGTETQTLFGGTPTVQDAVLKETFYCGGAMAQYFFSSAFWAGAGGQYDYISSGTLKVGPAAETALGSASLVSFIYLYGAAGYDFPISTSLYLTTELKFGALLSNPLILEGDFTLNLSYAF